MPEDKTYDILVHNGTVLTVNRTFDVLEKGLVCMADGRLERVEAEASGHVLPSARQIIDARGGIICRDWSTLIPMPP